MTTIDGTGRPAYMYDEDTSTWYAISGRISTAANYVWTGANEWQNNSFFTGNVVAKNKINSFLNPAARTSAIPSPGIGLITFLQQDAIGNTINRFEYYDGSSWVAYADPATTVTLTGTQTLTNKTLSSASVSGGTINSASVVNSVLTSPEELITISATSASGLTNFDCLTQGVLYYSASATGNFTLNFRGNSTTTLNSVLSTGQSITCSFLNTSGTTAYYANAFQIDGSSVTPKWSGGTAPSSGNISSIDAYTFTIIKTANATFTVLAGAVQFK